jgi:Zn-dependent protease
MDAAMPLEFILAMVLTLVFSVIVHEIAHGLAAYYFGDDTAYLQGRLTFDPIKHIDPFLTILLPIATYFAMGFPFGGAKPVPVNPYRLRRMRKDMLWIALAGPASNIALALIISGVLRLSVLLTPGAEAGSVADSTQIILAYAILINLALACFNMIPVPPLDGSRVLMGILPRELAQAVAKLEQFGFIIVILLVATRATVYLIRIPVFFSVELLIPPEAVERLARFMAA